MNVLVVIMMVAGVMQPNRMEIVATSGNCMAEIQTVNAINRVNRAAGSDVQYLVSCENR